MLAAVHYSSTVCRSVSSGPRSGMPRGLNSGLRQWTFLARGGGLPWGLVALYHGIAWGPLRTTRLVVRSRGRAAGGVGVTKRARRPIGCSLSSS